MSSDHPVQALPDSAIDDRLSPTSTEMGQKGAGRRRRGPLAVLTFSHGAIHAYTAALPLTYPAVVAEFHVSYAVLGVWLGAAGLAGGLLQGLAGAFRRVSARLLLTVQDLLTAAAAVLGALAPGFIVYGVARISGSVVSWPQHPVGAAVLAESYPERRSTALSWHTVGGSLGTLAVPLAAGAVIARWGWRPALALSAVPLLVAAGLVAVRLRTVAPPSSQQESPGLGLRRLLFSRRTLVVLVVSTVAAGGRGLGVLNSYVPAYLQSGLHIPPFTVGAIFTVMLAGSAVGPVLAGRLADRWGRLRITLISYLLAAAAIADFGLVGAGVPGLVVLAALVGILAYAESPLLQALFADAIEGSPQQAAFGVYFAITYGIGSLWVTLIGWVIDSAGFRTAFLVMAASFVLAAAILPAARERPSGRGRRPGS
ncbi:MAG: MFS transporter [Candidatus Dormiibacterota bacterium]